MTTFRVSDVAQMLIDKGVSSDDAFEMANKVLNLTGFGGVAYHYNLGKDEISLFTMLEDMGIVDISLEWVNHNGKDFWYAYYELRKKPRETSFTPSNEELDLLNLLAEYPQHRDMVKFLEKEDVANSLLAKGLIKNSNLDGGTYFINYSLAKDVLNKFNERLQLGDGLLISFIVNELEKKKQRRGPYSFYSAIKNEFGATYNLEYIKSLTSYAIRLLLADYILKGGSINQFEKEHHIDVAKYGIDSKFIESLGKRRRYRLSKDDVIDELYEHLKDFNGRLSENILSKEYNITIHHYGLTFEELILELRNRGVDVLPIKILKENEAKMLITSYLVKNKVAKLTELEDYVCEYLSNKWKADIKKCDLKKPLKKLEDDGKIVRVKAPYDAYISLREYANMLGDIMSKDYYIVNGYKIKKHSNAGNLFKRIVQENLKTNQLSQKEKYALKYLKRKGIVSVCNGVIKLNAPAGI
ncbi:MAG: hypothetical protein J7K22_03700 [Nanoarchaeota archaeon]|nr:hypothetical protein [Nanoarchaeota archaeon]